MRRFWGWGYEGEGPDPAQLAALEPALAGLLGLTQLEQATPPRVEDVPLAAPRVALPSSLADLDGTTPFERLGHAQGKSYRDVVRGLRGEFPHAPDVVALPRTAADVARLLDWSSSQRVAVVPYGGGSSVCGGVEPDVGDGFRGTLSLDLARLDRVLEVDTASRSACIQGGALGPSLESQLRPHGLTLRHFPQSFELSTLGGWIATRSGGHFATLFTHIDELVSSLTIVTPSGTLATRRLPGDGAGPAPERWFIGSEGALGVITEAWLRVFERPRFRASFTASWPDLAGAARAQRALAQSGLYPANCRVLDPTEAFLNGAGGGDALLLVAFESSDHPLGPWLERAAELCRDHGGSVPGGLRTATEGDAGEREGAAGAWRAAFLRAPYLRDALVRLGVFVETYETAITWDRFEGLVNAVRAAALAAAPARAGAPAIVTCRITHAYPDGCAPYFTVITSMDRGAPLAQADRVKDAITRAMLASGGTVTHHHAVGRDVRPFYEEQRPAAFARALSAVKRELDPAGILNPGVLLPSTARGAADMETP